VRPDALLELFATAAAAQRDAVAGLRGAARRARTAKPGQYELDLVADRAVLEVLHRAPVGVVSEESGRSGTPDAGITVVVDPVDGSTNCSRHIPYWGISLAALDRDGVVCGLVENTTTGEQFRAARGAGAQANGAALHAAETTRLADAIVAVSGLPQVATWKQYRALGSLALALCDVAAGRLDAFLDVLIDQHAPWDYLAGALICREAGGCVVDAAGRTLDVTDHAARRRILAAATAPLLAALQDLHA
jgi:fructose-1,6-bisphosphatase/inositol monophosphatase family enzyme